MSRTPSIKNQLSRMSEAQKDYAIEVLAEALSEGFACGACKYGAYGRERHPCNKCARIGNLVDDYFVLVRLEGLNDQN